LIILENILNFKLFVYICPFKLCEYFAFVSMPGNFLVIEGFTELYTSVSNLLSTDMLASLDKFF